MDGVSSRWSSHFKRGSKTAHKAPRTLLWSVAFGAVFLGDNVLSSLQAPETTLSHQILGGQPNPRLHWRTVGDLWTLGKVLSV